MTTANKITILRILLIPFFVVELIYYLQTGNEIHRLLALLSFAITAILDGVDGYIARRYNQKSELGAILDPLADKLLLVSAIVTLSFNRSPHLGQIPLWLTGTDHRTRFAAAHRHCGHPAHRRQGQGPPAFVRQNCHGLSNDRGRSGFCWIGTAI